MEDLGSVIYIVESPGSPPLARGGPPTEVHSIEVETFEGAEIHALGFQCERLEALGFGKTGEQWIMPKGARVREPDRVSRAVLDSRYVPSWETLPTPPEHLPAALGYVFTSTTPCLELDAEPLGLSFSGDVWLLPVREEEVLASRPKGRFDLVHQDGSIEPLSSSTTAPSNSAFLGEDGELWIYGEGGRLWHTPLAALVDGNASWIREPVNPFWSACESQRYQIDGGPSDTPEELFVTDRQGGIARFDLPSGTWSEIAPQLPTSTRLAPSGLPSCPLRRFDLLWRSRGKLVAVRSSTQEVIDYDSSTGLTVSRPTIDGARLGGPQVVAEVPGLGLLFGTSDYELLRRDPEGRWEVLVELSTLFERFDFGTIIPFGDNRVLWPGDGGVRVYDRDYGFCETTAHSGVNARELVPAFGRRGSFLAATWGNSRALWKLETKPRDPCSADPP
jgi:hypothetical protein